MCICGMARKATFFVQKAAWSMCHEWFFVPFGGSTRHQGVRHWMIQVNAANTLLIIPIIIDIDAFHLNSAVAISGALSALLVGCIETSVPMLHVPGACSFDDVWPFAEDLCIRPRLPPSSEDVLKSF